MSGSLFCIIYVGAVLHKRMGLSAHVVVDPTAIFKTVSCQMTFDASHD